MDAEPDAVEFSAADYDAACEADEAYQACLKAMAATAQLSAEDVVLDMATGTGNFALALAPRVRAVHARDADPEWLEHARMKCRALGLTNVTFAEGTLADPAVDGPVTVVVAGYLLHTVIDELGGPDGLEPALRALVARRPRRLLLPDYYSEDPRAEHGTPLPHLEATLSRVGYALVGVEWFGESEALVVAEPASR